MQLDKAYTNSYRIHDSTKGLKMGRSPLLRPSLADLNYCTVKAIAAIHQSTVVK